MTSRQRTVLIVAVLASFVAFLDGSVINVALPAIERDLGGGLVLQQWVVDAYLITLGSLILVAGSLSDVFGRRRILRLGLLGFGVFSLACAFAPSGILLIAARAAQGVAGALLVPSSLALIISEFSGAAQGKAIGRWTAWTGIAFILGPTLGGFFVDVLSWRWVFAINVVPIAVTMILLARLGGTDERSSRRVDYPGAALGALGLGAVVFALIQQGSLGWADPAVWGALLIGIAALASFWWVERHSSDPMLPAAIFRVHNFWVGNIATAAVYAALAFGPFIVTLYVQQVAGYPATFAGLAMTPSTIVMLALSGTFGSLAGRYGPRLFMTIGPLVAAAGFVTMFAMGHSVFYWTELLPGILLLGLGLSITVAPLTSAILSAIEPAQAGIGSAVNNAVSRIAGLIAVACAGSIIGGALDHAGVQRGLLATVVLMLAGAVISALGIRNPARVRREAPDPRPAA
ncbi:MAG TPA: MFS transporter [Humibacter sp.]|nr:MFS transporter [Humibacter sp.]